MRITVELSDDLYRAATVRAADEGRTLTDLVEEALRILLDRPASGVEPYRVEPLMSGTPGEIPFDVGDNAATRDYLGAAERDRRDSRP